MTTRSPLLLVPGLLALLVEPCLWLVHTWSSPAYDSPGALVALLVGLLLLGSVRSGALPPRALGPDTMGLLLGAALLRLIGRFFAVNHVGGLALVLDVWALARLLQVSSRPFALSPAGLAACFAFALPAEQVLQRLFAWPLRLGAARLTELTLSPFVDGLRRTGTVLSRPGLELAVDLPCSGAQGLTLLGLCLATLAAVRSPRPGQLLVGGLAALVGGLIGNATRVATLLLVPAWMEEPAHTLVGLVGLGVGALPLFAAARRWSGRPARPPVAPRPFPLPAPLALGFSAVALAIACAPHHPLDVSPPQQGPGLPTSLGAHTGRVLPLSAEESAYFARYGGSVEKRAYTGAGPERVALVVRSAAPLRHLHDPEVCLRGAGHTVQRLGVRADPVLTTVWRSVDPAGAAWRVEASFVSATGAQASTGSEVAWRWLSAPSVGWMLVERITPFSSCEADPAGCLAFEQALFRALDVEVNA